LLSTVVVLMGSIQYGMWREPCGKNTE
jgi:hypothetical protein